MIKVEITTDDLLPDIVLVLGVKGQETRHDEIEYYSKRPGVGFFIILLFKNHFRSHVVASSNNFVLDAIANSDLAKTEVNQFDVVALSDHYVFRLDVSVDDVIGVTVADSFEQLFHILCCLLLVQIIIFGITQLID